MQTFKQKLAQLEQRQDNSDTSDDDDDDDDDNCEDDDNESSDDDLPLAAAFGDIVAELFSEYQKVVTGHASVQ